MVISTGGLNGSNKQSVVQMGGVFLMRAKRERGGLTMQLSKSVNVLGVKYKVKLQSRLIENDESLLGMTDFPNDTIWLRKGMDMQRTQQTLIHELVHAMLYEVGNDDYNSENLVNPLGNILYQVIKDNKLIK